MSADTVSIARLRELLEKATPGELDVLAERRRQVAVEGWTPEHDDGHSSTDAFGRFSSRPSGLAFAAACYAIGQTEVGRQRFGPAVKLWPWDMEWWKPKDRRRDLVRAGALILAEIDRLDRAAGVPAVNALPHDLGGR